MGAIIDKSFDELLTIEEDAFDASISPSYVKRVDNNKLHLIFKANAAGHKVLMNSILTVRNRYDPLYCEVSDLKSLATMLGTKYKSGKKSIVQVTVVNSSVASAATLVAGVYQFTSSSGEKFYFTLATDVLFSALEYLVYSMSSANLGAFAVSASTSLSVSRSDGGTIDGNFVFSCVDNVANLGYGAETDAEFRVRVSTDTSRQDQLNRIQEDIKGLTSIFECNLMFNASTNNAVYDGITLAPKELLVVLTGVPSADVAEIIASYTCYKTHMVSSGLVVNYLNDLYVGGVYPVYYKFHDTTPYALSITYEYRTNTKQTQVEAAFNTLLNIFKTSNTHVDRITEEDFYTCLKACTIASVKVLSISILVGGTEVGYVTIPKTRIPKLTDVAYTSVLLTS